MLVDATDVHDRLPVGPAGRAVGMNRSRPFPRIVRALVSVPGVSLKPQANNTRPNRLATAMRRSAGWIACILAVAGTAHAGDKEEAEKHFRAGLSLQKLEDFDAAIAAFETSLRLYPTKSALFNLANCLRAAHRYDEALKALERLDHEYGTELDSAMRLAVDEQLQELRNLSASLVVEVDQTGAEVWIDGKLVGRSPLSETMYLSPGAHEVEVRLEGYEPKKTRVELLSRQTTTERVVLVKVAPPNEPPPRPLSPPPVVPSPKAPPPEPERSTALTTAGWITAGTGAALLVGGTVTGIWALSVDSSLEQDCVDGHCPPSRSSDIDRLDTLATTTNVLLGVGVAVTTAGVFMLLSDAPPGREKDAAPGVGFAVGPELVGASFQQRFW